MARFAVFTIVLFAFGVSLTSSTSPATSEDGQVIENGVAMLVDGKRMIAVEGGTDVGNGFATSVDGFKGTIGVEGGTDVGNGFATLVDGFKGTIGVEGGTSSVNRLC